MKRDYGGEKNKNSKQGLNIILSVTPGSPVVKKHVFSQQICIAPPLDASSSLG